jgi:hypothetical protein
MSPVPFRTLVKFEKKIIRLKNQDTPRKPCGRPAQDKTIATLP